MCFRVCGRPSKISIHALRGEGDISIKIIAKRNKNFYPRPPWGGRRYQQAAFFITNKFLSTPSVGRATY